MFYLKEVSIYFLLQVLMVSSCSPQQMVNHISWSETPSPAWFTSMRAVERWPRCSWEYLLVWEPSYLAGLPGNITRRVELRWSYEVTRIHWPVLDTIGETDLLETLLKTTMIMFVRILPVLCVWELRERWSSCHVATCVFVLTVLTRCYHVEPRVQCAGEILPVFYLPTYHNNMW